MVSGKCYNPLTFLTLKINLKNITYYLFISLYYAKILIEIEDKVK